MLFINDGMHWFPVHNYIYEDGAADEFRVGM